MSTNNKVLSLAAHRAAKRPPLQSTPFRAHTIECHKTHGGSTYNVYGWYAPPNQAALLEQDLSQNIVDRFPALAAALAAYPKGNIISGRLRRLVLRAPWPEEWATLERWRQGSSSAAPTSNECE